MFGILCFGDSLTFGVGETPAKGWCGRLKDYFEPKGDYNAVYNLGVPGHNSLDLVKRFDAEAVGRIRIKRDSDKYLILIAIGTNDCKWDGMPEENNPRTTEEEFEKNIQELINKSKNYNAKLAFIGLPPIDESRTLPFEDTSFKNERVKLFNDIIKEGCNKNEVFFLDIYDLILKEDYPKILKDGLHPNSRGYDLIYEKIKEFLEKTKLL